jgi:hypothetical protein
MFMKNWRAALVLGPWLALSVAACGNGSDEALPLGGVYDTGPGIVFPPTGPDAATRSDAGRSHAGTDAGGADVDAARDGSFADGAHDGARASSSDAGTDAPLDAPFPAFATDVPQVQDNSGPILASANFVPVVFAGDTLAGPIGSFMASIGGSAYWTSVASEYGVGAATSAPLIVDSYAPAAAITDAQIQSWLANAIATDPRFLALNVPSDAGIQPPDPAAVPPAGTLYVLFYPDGVTINDGAGTSCDAFGGYHYTTTLGNGATVIYAVVPRCAMFNGLTGIDAVTSGASHELLEATTDPEPYANPAWVGTDQDHFIWELVIGNGELGDMCSFVPDPYIHPSDPALSSFLVQRMWSNKAAAAGDDPCVPATGETVYFNTVPETTEVTFVDQGMSYQTFGTAIPVGNTGTITLDLSSNGPTGGPWTVYPLDYGAAFNNPTVLDISIVGAGTGTNGQKVTLQVKPLSAGTAALFGMEPYFLYSTNQAGNVITFWTGVVVN